MIYEGEERDRREPPGTTPMVIKKTHTSAMIENHLPIMTTKKTTLLTAKIKTKIPKKLTKTSQRPQERKQVLQQYSQVLPEEGFSLKKHPLTKPKMTAI